MAAGRSLSTEKTSPSLSLMAATGKDEEEDEDGDGYTLPLFFIFMVSLAFLFSGLMREYGDVWRKEERERERDDRVL